MSRLLLPSLEITNFRAFAHLKIERLGRVNLIVGKNNVGKSSLLEALRVYARRGHPSLLLELLDARQEFDRPTASDPAFSPVDLVFNFRYLFHGRLDIRTFQAGDDLKIGPVGAPDETLALSIMWASEQPDEPRTRQTYGVGSDELTIDIGLSPTLVVKVGARTMGLYKLNDQAISNWVSRHPRVSALRLHDNGMLAVFVSANGLDDRLTGQYWDSIALTDQEQQVLDALRVIAPEVERVNLVGDQNGQRRRVPMVKVTGIDEPVPLRSLGEGMNRLFSLALALVSARDGFLLIDEIESGLHYSVLADVWRLVFEVAHRLNVQVFATSHSWDCIEAFQQAAQEDIEEQGVLVRLERKQGGIVPVHFDEDELEIVTRRQIEVR